MKERKYMIHLINWSGRKILFYNEFQDISSLCLFVSDVHFECLFNYFCWSSGRWSGWGQTSKRRSLYFQKKLFSKIISIQRGSEYQTSEYQAAPNAVFLCMVFRWSPLQPSFQERHVKIVRSCLINWTISHDMNVTEGFLTKLKLLWWLCQER